MSGPGSEQGFRLTDKDKQLLALLQKNAREPTSSLARKIGVSRTALQERIQRLESAGVIEGYSVRINQSKLIYTVNCFTLAVCNNKTYSDVVAQMRMMDSVQAVYAISGDWDFVIHVATETLEKLNAELTRINMIKGVARTTSCIVMETKFDRRLAFMGRMGPNLLEDAGGPPSPEDGAGAADPAPGLEAGG
ncbi:Lrp/AsnC family transcriptional regulator [Azospirillum picis]|uniref:DNA-binding Lrp family transcriptional regulator n=1 Tax=Azospirillum picis TaxID=488438 RepID=A0ABU0MP64_9PROT|nr:Lrp/AsnC family transcriptional regulator [Azospirillum picis]MBP2303548.1 DNA-binding Lrp family transcriptional regulator [Azospirillum picis]MDQ0534946.1 DNA-binding Lrp family transcriptional regulator [Azospirillum picis]